MRTPNLAHVAIALASVFGVSYLGYAALGGPSGVLIPYQGYLRLSGVPVTSTVQLTFNIWDSATDGYMCHSETQSVTPSAGKFGVTIGPLPDAADCLVDNDVWLELEDPDGNIMGARQRVMPSLAAATSGRGDFDVTGTLHADGLATLNGGLTVTQGLDVNSGGVTVASSAPKTLDVNGHTETNSLDVLNNVTVGSDGSGNLTVNGTFTANSLDVSEMNLTSTDLTVAAGVVTWKCPAAAPYRVGAKCVTGDQGNQGNWRASMDHCHDLGMDLCPMETMVLCDHQGGNTPCDLAMNLSCTWATTGGDLTSCSVITSTPWTDDENQLGDNHDSQGTCLIDRINNWVGNSTFDYDNVRVKCNAAAHSFCCAPISFAP
jgi:hypothetical protein